MNEDKEESSLFNQPTEPIKPVEVEVMSPEADLHRDLREETQRDPETYTSPPRMELQLPAPTSLEQVAAMHETAAKVIDARIDIVKRLRVASLKLTNPEDWVLNQNRDGRVTGYLQDAGCERIQPLWGIDVFNVGEPQRMASTDDDSFCYWMTGDGRSRFTGGSVEGAMGVRYSNDDFIVNSKKKGIQLEFLLRKCARANLDGNIIRTISGLHLVPIEEIQEAWAGTKKITEHCAWGKGFSAQERSARQGQSGPAPACPICNGRTHFVKAGEGRNGPYPAFWGCDSRDCKGKVPDAKWKEEQQAKQPKPEKPKADDQKPPNFS